MSLDKVRKRLAKKSARVQNFMNSEIGKDLIDVIEDEFYHGELFDNDPYRTAYNLGRRDVVIFLKQLLNWKDHE